MRRCVSRRTLLKSLISVDLGETLNAVTCHIPIHSNMQITTTD